MTYYFAYGSNLNHDQMSRRCPAAKPISPATLADYELSFRTVADIGPKPGRYVAGGLWEVTPECEAALDRYEGVKGGLYRREFVTVDLPNGRQERALVYIMNEGDPFPPAAWYAGAIAEGYKDFGLAVDTLRDAIFASVSQASKPRRPGKQTRPASKSRHMANT